MIGQIKLASYLFLIRFSIPLCPAFGDATCVADLIAGEKSESSDVGLESFRSCGKLAPNGIFTPNIDFLRSLDFAENDLACVFVKDVNHRFYVNKSGKSRQVIVFDNSCDDFSEGLAREIQGGSVLFFDRDLNTKLSIKASYASPFKNGISHVCRNGTSESTPAEEHSQIICLERWINVDQQGQIVMKGSP